MRFFKQLVNHNQAGSFVNRLRQKRFLLIQTELQRMIAEKGHIRVLDIGGEMAYWRNMGWQNPACTICLFNLPSAHTPPDAPGFYHITGNALQLPFQPGEFDLVFSNSVIEHVGSIANQAIFANEVRRVCNKYIIQTPSFWFPLEPHSLLPLFQYIPHSIRAYLIKWFNINYFPKAATYAEALAISKTTIMFTRNRYKKLFPGADIHVEYLLGIAKSYTAAKL